ncbi:PTS mannose/fructose/sorbose/N-acetylgalactosamine transporter subunit IIC [Floccifex sp.]|uniref:PTS mannose/fructose/sorbose/N-acetylgalactosamine transporter subunit IIC n=1 Tax=Floccifex sp. TaxID=2815810 RepID=UPI002A7536DC|nr:PTS sugar transporter subunit IIC [Floccifex sp.]MDD7280441.1 PTS sugar transporter subunit IIC [Erysipelotrichaceae bacterium]MDY2957457.1 PTS sugar transporter subunit IIC [Floccifex sp.]
MLVQAILLGLVAMLGNAEYLLGTSLLSRPIVMGTLTGIVLGDIPTGVALGATLELAFMGSFSIGASIPPEMISGTVLGTAFTITTGAGPETAITVGIPVASLVLIAKNIGMVFILPPFVHKADDYAAKGDMKGVARMHFLGGFFGVNLIIGLCVGCGYYAGGPAVNALLSVIPEWVNNGLQITMGLLPAIGFGLLLKMIMNKEVACFFILGFALSVYLGIPTTGIAIFGVIIAIVLTQLKSNKVQGELVQGGNDDDDDF